MQQQFGVDARVLGDSDDPRSKSATGTTVPSRNNVILTLAALLLSVLALVVAIEGRSGSASAPAASTTIFHLATAILGIVGAIGYWCGKNGACILSRSRC